MRVYSPNGIYKVIATTFEIDAKNPLEVFRKRERKFEINKTICFRFVLSLML